MQEADVYISLKQAAELAGVSIDTLRRRRKTAPPGAFIREGDGLAAPWLVSSLWIRQTFTIPTGSGPPMQAQAPRQLAPTSDAQAGTALAYAGDELRGDVDAIRQTVQDAAAMLKAIQTAQAQAALQVEGLADALRRIESNAQTTGSDDELRADVEIIRRTLAAIQAHVTAAAVQAIAKPEPTGDVEQLRDELAQARKAIAALRKSVAASTSERVAKAGRQERWAVWAAVVAAVTIAGAVVAAVVRGL